MSHHNQHRWEEVLELLWNMVEEGRSDVAELLKRSDDPEVEGILLEMAEKGLIVRENGSFRLTGQGELEARSVIRRHRLAERLLVDILDVNDEHSLESGACEFEHIISEDVIERVCTFLGHPPVCPHGKPIPPGDCCSSFEKKLKPLVCRLTDMEPGGFGKITFMGPGTESGMERMATLGVLPGACVRLKQRKPALVIQVDETMVAIDPVIGKEIFVRTMKDHDEERTLQHGRGTAGDGGGADGGSGWGGRGSGRCGGNCTGDRCGGGNGDDGIDKSGGKGKGRGIGIGRGRGRGWGRLFGN